MKKPILLLTLLGFFCMQSYTQPANDACADAILVTCDSSTSGTSTDATIDDSAPFCGNPLGITGPGVWYTFVGTGDAITASLCGSAFDTKIIVYSGVCDDLTCIVGNDDACALQSETNFNSVLDTDYYILITGYQMNAGDFTLNLTCSAPCEPIPANNDCSGAISLTVADDLDSCVPTIGTNECATAALTNPLCFQFAVVEGVWYEFNTGANTGISLDFETITGVQNTFGYAISLTCTDEFLLCGGLNEGSTMINGLDAQTTYYLLVASIGLGNTGTFSICLSAPTPPPANDECSAATPTELVNGASATSFTGTTIGGTMGAEEQVVFNNGAVWEAVTLTGDCNDLRVDYCGTDAGNMVNGFIVYTDCPLTIFTAGAWETTSCSDANITTTFLDVPPGTYYLPVIVDPLSNILGDYIMNVRSVDCGASGLDELSSEDLTLLFPNPAVEVLNISFDFAAETIVTITDQLGKVVLKEYFKSSYDISYLHNGAYVVDIQGDGIRHIEKFMKTD